MQFSDPSLLKFPPNGLLHPLVVVPHQSQRLFLLFVVHVEIAFNAGNCFQLLRSYMDSSYGTSRYISTMVHALTQRCCSTTERYYCCIASRTFFISIASRTIKCAKRTQHATTAQQPPSRTPQPHAPNHNSQKPRFVLRLHSHSWCLIIAFAPRQPPRHRRPARRHFDVILQIRTAAMRGSRNRCHRRSRQAQFFSVSQQCTLLFTSFIGELPSDG